MKRLLHIVVFCLFLVLLLSIEIPVCIVTVKGVSMEPSLKDGQKLFVVTSQKRIRDADVGDIIVFRFEGKTCIKRCVGCPGDTVSIVCGVYRNSRTGGVGISMDCQEPLMDGTRQWYYGNEKCIAFPFSPELGWTIRDFGPLYVPAKGDFMEDVDDNILKYKYVFEQESLGSTFRHNWYFVAGDNVLCSNDSRYFGLVPEEHIVGIVIR